MIKKTFKTETLTIAGMASSLMMGAAFASDTATCNDPTLDPGAVKVANLIETAPGHSPTQVDQWVRNGCPHAKTGEKGYDQHAVIVSLGGEDRYAMAAQCAAARIQTEDNNIDAFYIRSYDNNSDRDDVATSTYAFGQQGRAANSYSPFLPFDAALAEKHDIENNVYTSALETYSRYKPATLASARVSSINYD